MLKLHLVIKDATSQEAVASTLSEIATRIRAGLHSGNSADSGYILSQQTKEDEDFIKLTSAAIHVFDGLTNESQVLLKPVLDYLSALESFRNETLAKQVVGPV